jgi:hypothetical protein
MLEVFATLLGLIALGIVGYGLWRFSHQGPSRPSR